MIKRFFLNFLKFDYFKSAEEKYLAQSSDLADLERRQRQLQYKMKNEVRYWI